MLYKQILLSMYHAAGQKKENTEKERLGYSAPFGKSSEQTYGFGLYQLLFLMNLIEFHGDRCI